MVEAYNSQEGRVNELKRKYSAPSITVSEKPRGGGNTRLPFGLCERFGIKLPKGATPRQAWEALKKEKGITSEAVYSALKSGTKLNEHNFEKKEEAPKKKKNSYSEYLQSIKDKDKQRFFGDTKQVSNNYFTFNHVKDENNITIVTSNIKEVKDSLVLIVDNNKAVYLKDWQVKRVRNYDNGIYAYAVKLNRDYFRPYTFKSDFNNMSFEKEDTFDDLLDAAKSQDKENMKVALGWGALS